MRCVVAILALTVPALGAQTRADTVALSDLHARAVAADPRDVQHSLLTAQARLRERNLDSEMRPSLVFETQAQYQSDVPRIRVPIPGVPTPPHDSYDARIAARQHLYDPTRGPRRALERARLGQATAAVEQSLDAVRQQVNDAFFAALRAQVQAEELAAGIAELEEQLRVAELRVREGAAMGSEAHTIRAELLRRRQLLLDAGANRRIALDLLGDLTGKALDAATVLVAPDLEQAVASARASLDARRAFPRKEYEHFARSRDVLAVQERIRAAQDRPRVSAFGRAGYGRPGINPFNDAFDSYWLAGVQLEWTPWAWGAGARDRELLALQRRIIEADERAFTGQLWRAALRDFAAIDRLSVTLAADDEIIAIRERIAAEARARFGEGVVTSAEYVDRQGDVLGARLTRALHRTELAQARARVLTTLGFEVR